MKAKISIIIPNYNYAKYLQSALNSVLHQTFQDWECIIIDDGSLDDSVKVIEKFVARDSRFQLIKQPHSGIPTARNRGLDAAKGDYIAFLDADDAYAQTALDSLYQVAQMTDADMVGGNALLVADSFEFYPSGSVAVGATPFYTESNPSRYFCNSRNQNWFWLWRRIYKRSLIGETRFHTDFMSVGEDIAFMMDIGWKSENMADTDVIVCYHRKHSDSISINTRGKDYYSFFSTILDYVSGVVSDKYDDHFLKIFYESITNYLLFETIFKPKMFKTNLADARDALLESAKKIPLKYLSWKKRFFIWYLRCVK